MKTFKLITILLLAQTAWTQGTIHLKSRDLRPVAPSSPAVSSSPASMPDSTAGAKQHFLILFTSYPGPDVLAELQARRITVLAYVPDNALMVSAVKLNLRGLNVQWSGPMDPSDKISPMLSNQPMGSYLVIWHPDTDAAANTELAQNIGFSVTPNSYLLAGQMVVSGAFSALPSLAALDEVSYVLPASSELQNGDVVIGCAGPTTRVGPAPQYVKADGGWSKDASGHVALGYYLESLTPKVPESQIRSEVGRAFAAWAKYSNITISAVAQPGLVRTIEVMFARYAHGDAYPFNGPGGVIAHTFYPAPSNPEPLAGDMHLNGDEAWSVGGAAGTVDLFSVALHEAGHALGLAHSDDPSSVMYPYYRLQTALTADDIAGIQALYGAPASSTPPAVSTGSNSSTGTGATSSSGSGTAPTTGTPPATNGGTGSTSAGADTVAPTVAIVTPGGSMVSTSAATISISGTASDNVAVHSVQWSTSNGYSGTASGTTAWSAVIPLLVGNNTVTVRAYDAAGNTSWRAVTVVRN